MAIQHKATQLGTIIAAKGIFEDLAEFAALQTFLTKSKGIVNAVTQLRSQSKRLIVHYQTTGGIEWVAVACKQIFFSLLTAFVTLITCRLWIQQRINNLYLSKVSSESVEHEADEEFFYLIVLHLEYFEK